MTKGVRVAGRLDLLPLLLDGDGLPGQVGDVLGDQGDDRLEDLGLGLLERRLGELEAGLEDQLRQRLRLLGLDGLVTLVEELEVLPVVEDQEVRLVLAGSEQVLAEPGAAADHLPELDVGVDRLGEDEVDDLGHVDAGVEHVHRDGDGQSGLLPSPLKSSISSSARGS